MWDRTPCLIRRAFYYLKRMKHAWFALLILLSPPAMAEEDVYQKPEEFVREVFQQNPPPPKTFRITDDLRPAVDQIMTHPYPVSRTTFWARSGRSAWILEEIGKYKPITVGIVIDQGNIEQVKVLVYRESHGWQVQHAFFTDQFKGAALTDEKNLSKPIDNISGATMSVDALRNLGKLALYLNQHANARP